MKLTDLSGEFNDCENMRKTLSSLMLFSAFKELSATLSLLDISFISLTKEEIEASRMDSLFPIHEMGHFKMPEQSDRREKSTNDLVKEQLMFMYFAYVNLSRAHHWHIDI